MEGSRAVTKYIDLELTASYYETPETILDKKASAGIEKYDDSKNVSEIAPGFFAEFQIEEGYSSSSGEIKKSINKLAAKEGNNNPTDLSQLKLKKLENGVKFMVLIFDENDIHVGTTLATMGEQTRIPVVYKKDYVFNTSNYYRVVAFTYNTKNESGYDSLNLDPTQTADNPKLVIPSDKEFFYYNGDFLIDPKVTDVSYKLPIVFLPQTVKVGVTVDGKGANVKVKKMSGTFGSFSMRSTAEFD